MKCFLYILKNKEGRYYVGITKLLPNRRLIRHNQGDVVATKFYRPWEIVYCEEYSNYIEARRRERQIKSWKGGNAFKRFLSSAGESSNGRTEAFGAFNLGSSPSSPALERRVNFGGVKQDNSLWRRKL